MPKSQPLNSKDSSAFQRALIHYEKKEYEQSLAEVEGIIERRKDQLHGESFCLKSLLLYHLKKEPDAETLKECDELTAKGSEIDSESHVAWHMAGIYYKLRTEYRKALKAYMSSYQLNPDNSNVYQDLAMLAAQLRDFPTLVDVRRKALTQHMNQRMSWAALIAALFLDKKYTEVENTVELYDRVMEVERKQVKDPKVDDRVERSECLMLKAEAIVAQNKPKRALNYLYTIEPNVRDKLAWCELEAKLLVEVNKPEAKKRYLLLIQRNPSDVEYYKQAMKLSEDPVGLLKELSAANPKELTPCFLLLNELDSTSPEFTELFMKTLLSQLSRNVLTTFVLFKDFYSNPAVIKLIDDNIAQLKDSCDEVPFAVFIAYHYSYSNRHSDALTAIEDGKPIADADAGTDVDTQADYLLAYSHILTRAGDLAAAQAALAKASGKLPGDVYLNTKYTAACFKNSDVSAGYKAAFRFYIQGKHAKDDAEAMNYITSIESVNTVINMASAHMIRQEYGLALKRALNVIDIFNIYQREQYDFHFFGPRKGTLRTYINMVEWEQSVYDHDVYARAVDIVSTVWVTINAKYLDVVGEENTTLGNSWRKEMLEKVDTKTDSDPFGVAALESPDGLSRAVEVLKTLEKVRPTPLVYLKELEVYAAQKKHVLATQSLKKAKERGATNSQIAMGACIIRHALDTDDHVPDIIKQMQLKLLPTIATEGDVLNDELLQYTNSFVTNVLDWLKTRRILRLTENLSTEAAEKIEELVTEEDLESAYQELRISGVDTEPFVKTSKELWPRVSFF